MINKFGEHVPTDEAVKTKNLACPERKLGVSMTTLT